MALQDNHPDAVGPVLFGWAKAAAAHTGTRYGEHYAGLKAAEAVANEQKVGIWRP